MKLRTRPEPSNRNDSDRRSFEPGENSPRFLLRFSLPVALGLGLFSGLPSCNGGGSTSASDGDDGLGGAPDSEGPDDMMGDGGTGSGDGDGDGGTGTGGTGVDPDVTCDAPSVEVDGNCRIPCDVLPCEADQRHCIDATKAEDAECGACLEGYAENGSGVCVLTTCNPNASGSLKQDCDLERRECVGADGSAECGDCLPGYSAESDTGICRAQCEEGCDCPTGFGWHPEENSCFSCAGAALDCSGAGETGNVWALQSEDGTACICETEDGYYTGSEGRTTFACDSDGDGWVVDSAQAAIESNNPVLRENARCSVRRVRRFVLRSESGGQLENDVDYAAEFPADVAKAIPAGLPLYESDRNDGQASADVLPKYSPTEGRAFLPEEVTSLTRACLSTSDDLNHNGVADIEEWAESPVGPPVRESTKLRAYYAQYTAFSYFLELHDGWYSSPTAQRGYPTYHIQERTRTESGAAGVAVDYPDGISSYVDTCGRGIDETYAENPPNTIGGDFSEWGDEAGMGHHSQFKCVQVLSSVTYQNGGYDASTHPHLIARQGETLSHATANGSTELDWTLNDCFISADAESGLSPGDPTNPVTPPVDCEAPETVENGSVHWAAVDFVPYGSRYETSTNRGDYVRGCFDQCVQDELEKTSCETCGADAEGRGVLGNATAGTPCGEGLVCSGSGECGSCVPGNTRCAGSTLQTCQATGSWVNATSCTFCATIETDVEAECRDCIPGDRDCSGDTPIYCNGQGQWVSESPCGGSHTCKGAGQCLTDDGYACQNDGDCFSGHCVSYYEDDDGDGYGGDTVVRACGGTPPDGTSSEGGDCCDIDPDAYPGQTAFFTGTTECGGFDYNCDEAHSRQYSALGQCQNGQGTEGWLSSQPPSCGQGDSWVTQWNYQYPCPNCPRTCYIPNYTTRYQACR